MKKILIISLLIIIVLVSGCKKESKENIRCVDIEISPTSFISNINYSVYLNSEFIGTYTIDDGASFTEGYKFGDNFTIKTEKGYEYSYSVMCGKIDLLVHEEGDNN